MAQPVGRLAPSPTGLLHLGHARTFLFAYWHARSQHGCKLPDALGRLWTDRAAEMRFADAALADLEWLGLDWDGPPLLQSTEVARQNAAISQLIAAGKAYPCVCSRGDIRSAQSAPHADSVELRYPGTCRGRFASFSDAERVSGRAAGARLHVPEGSISIADGVSGTSSWDVARDVGDFLIAKRDKAPAYQLAVVVDDAAQGVTEVLRGDDLLPSAARQWHVQNALGLPHPARGFHVPLVSDEHGRRPGQTRNRSSAWPSCAEGGTDPRTIVAWAANSAGMSVAERVTAREISPLFAIERVPREPLRLTREALEALKHAR